MAVRPGPVIFGFALLLLSLHPAFVGMFAGFLGGTGLVEVGERDLFASLGVVFVGLGILAYGCFELPRRGR